MEINGHLLPEGLQELLLSQKWSKEFNQTRLKKVTGSQCLWDFTLLSIEGMRRESSFSRLVSNPKLANIYGLASSRQVGEPIHDTEFLDTDMAVLIAVNYDEEAIALDYRVSSTAPRVLVGLVSNDLPTRWQIIAEDFDSFVFQIGF